MSNAHMSPTEAKKLSVLAFGRRQDVKLAVSLDRKTTLSIGWFRSGPRGGLAPAFAVRLLIDNGVAMGGCCTFPVEQANDAAACFEKYASGAIP